MKGWKLRLIGGRRDPQVEAEAALDFRDGQIEALQRQLAEMTRQRDVSRADAALAEVLISYYRAAARVRPVPVVRRHTWRTGFKALDHVTEVFRR